MGMVPMNYCRYEGDEQVSGRVQSGHDPQTGTGHVRKGERERGNLEPGGLKDHCCQNGWIK